MKPGDRVTHQIHGAGRVEWINGPDSLADVPWATVWFDTPSMDFNHGNVRNRITIPEGALTYEPA